VTAFDNFDPFYAREVKERNLAGLRRHGAFELVEGDLTDPRDVKHVFDVAVGVDLVVHLAALAGVRPSIADPAAFWKVNVSGSLNLFQACYARGIKRMVFASSSSVYGEGSQRPFSEQEACDHPLSPYAASKRAGELMAFNHHHLHGAWVTCLRFFTVYGPRQRPDLAIHKFTRLIDAERPVPIYGDGTSSRDYTWIDDIIDGVCAAIDQQTRADQPGFRVYNLGGSQPTRLRELVDRIADALGKPAIIDWRPEQPGDMAHTLADIRRAGAELGYAPQVSVEIGIPRFVKWWRLVQQG